MDCSSIYHRFCGAFARAEDGSLLSCTGPSADGIRESWAEITASVASPSSSLPDATDAGASRSRSSRIKLSQVRDGEELMLYESTDSRADGTIVGLLVRPAPEGDADFDNVFASLLLLSMKLFTVSPQPQSLESESGMEKTTAAIVDLFDARLRYISQGDKWHIQGREYFFNRVHEFVRRQARLEFCLPAFPCKSSNPDKVLGTMPDRGEQLALEHLHSFVEAVESVYPPGAKLWIVSDGHVFSDCIGVDDDMVDRYNAQLIQLNTITGQRRGATDRVGFKSLVDLFNLSQSMADAEGLPQLPALVSHISTKRTEAAELSRQILVRGCRTADGVLRSRIESGNHSALKLYRGFSRFMVEDLTLNTYTQHLSRSQLKKLAPKVSFEMIQRNEAYSNLVELLFPNHVRLSIHAHDNGGPKFGIRLFGRNVRALDRLAFDSAEMCSVDLLHVPTPWHNCLAEISGNPGLFMVKSKTVRDALAEGSFTGRWVDGSHEGIAGHFYLQPVSKPKASLEIENFSASETLTPEVVVEITPAKVARESRKTQVVIRESQYEKLDIQAMVYGEIPNNSHLWSTPTDADMMYARASLAGIGIF